jgi:acyl carrier protein
MDLAEIEELIIEFLAEDAGTEPPDLLEELLAHGERMPVDSLLAAEVVTRIQARVGVVLLATAETAYALRSVTTFAAAVHALLPAEESTVESA